MVIDLTALLFWALPGFLLGLLLGLSLSRTREAAQLRQYRNERDQAIAARIAAQHEAEQARVEAATARDQLRPLAEGIDRLKHEVDRRRASLEEAPPPHTEPASTPDVHPAPIAATPALDAAPSYAPDDLNHLKGVGPRMAARLKELGIVSIAQLAALDYADIRRLDADLGPFQGRIEKDQLVEQARLLQEGNMRAYEARYGKYTGGPPS